MEEGLDERSPSAGQRTAAAGVQAPSQDRICPFLGVTRDPQSRFAHPSPGHVCHAAKPTPIGLAYQAEYCLGGAYERCVRFEKAVGYPAEGQPLPADEGRSWLSVAGGGLLAVLALAGVVAVAVASGFLASPEDGGRSAVASSTSTTTFTPRPASPTQAPITPSPTAVAPTPTPTLPAATLSPAPSPTHEPSPAPDVIHVVQAGETLRSIGELYGLPWQLIAQANDIEEPDRIFVGQQLVIRATVEPGLDPLVHIVQRGETILDIAALYGVSPSELADANGLEDPDFIYIGQRLVIPGRTVESPVPGATP